MQGMDIESYLHHGVKITEKGGQVIVTMNAATFHQV